MSDPDGLEMLSSWKYLYVLDAGWNYLEKSKDFPCVRYSLVGHEMMPPPRAERGQKQMSKSLAFLFHLQVKHFSEGTCSGQILCC